MRLSGKERQMADKKLDTKAWVEKSRAAKANTPTKALQKKLGKKKNGAKFGKVNFNG